mmetsp:Transcript_14316/g.23697  ORF Transcript_14316/g.23697 Transcript_14316/m.23697 type:complete len:462 (+) Transcript_14316:162-1547(+)|eukprot:CAMPEP_0114428250 /NCGR_PEP_ID=MMETSP0103-20121206/8823_1 /TAXON_ID=37642 ORGANISM="Paraphysomonas imperforata, Strain PA2" /NCGR_SAMPLE_ID=MMETSP0103 /ASSEMBLY_ACC=CAM_ASM_000201 /LENGTH=461 /DNA_ID=CAMNT_0001597449 /DNA_START=152 /DNA_END=1537 /DNA_ORIENTATION=-
MGNSSSTEDQPPPPPPSEEQTPSQPSYYQMAKQGYQELVNAIIRPPRCQYSEQHLGPSKFKFCGKEFQRTDFKVTNPRNLEVCCSHWEPKERSNPILPCVIYMHGNSSSRLECLPNLAMLLSLGITVLAIDFAGSGSSEGDHVSLGYFEKDDLDCVIKHLRDGGSTSTIALWGRSMGAATALLHGERDPSIAGMILDSAFSSLVTLAEEMVEKGKEMGMPNVPQFVVRMAIRWIRSSVQKQAGFDIYELTPVQHADRCFIPALFVAGEEDEFVPPTHSQRIHDSYAGDKSLVLVAGDHNSARPGFFSHSAMIFLINTLQIPEHWMLNDGSDFTQGRMPWSSRALMGGLMNDFGGGEQAYLNFMLEENLAGGCVDVDGGLGMTTERQENVRNALYSMLGDSGANQRLNDQQNSSGEGVREEANGVSLSNSINAVEWSCTTCTLLNDAGVVVCSACGCANYSC